MTERYSRALPLHPHLYETRRNWLRPLKSPVRATPPPSNSGKSRVAGGWESASSCQIAQGCQGTTGWWRPAMLSCHLHWELTAGELCWGQTSTRRHLNKTDLFYNCFSAVYIFLIDFSIYTSLVLGLGLGLGFEFHKIRSWFRLNISFKKCLVSQEVIPSSLKYSSEIGAMHNWSQQVEACWIFKGSWS